jgi:hypothetical protein
MATAIFNEILETSYKSAKTEWMVTLEDEETIAHGAAAVKALAPTTFTSVNGKSLIIDDIAIAFTGIECDWFKCTVSYVERSTDAASSGTADPFPDADETISLQVSTQSQTANNIYMIPGATVTDAGTFGTAEKGYSETGFPVDQAKTVLNVKKKFESLPSGWATNISARIGKTNDAILFGAPIGSLKFIGVTTSEYPLDGYDGNGSMTFQYDYQAPTEAFTINGLSIPAKKGWEVYDFKLTPHGRGFTTVDWQILYPYIEADIAPSFT